MRQGEQNLLNPKHGGALSCQAGQDHVRPTIGGARHLYFAPPDAACGLASLQRLIYRLFSSQAHSHMLGGLSACAAVSCLVGREQAVEDVTALFGEHLLDPSDLDQIDPHPERMQSRS
jgi:hypothetical protein